MALLELENVSIAFGGLKAIDNVSFSIEEGTIFGLIGPNGAGKTTMFNIITANYKPTSGKVTFCGKDISRFKPNVIVNLGIARTFQNIRLFSSMSVLENVLIGLHNDAKYTFFEAMFRVGRFFKEEKRIKNRAIELLEYLGMGDKINLPANSLSYGNSRKVEIARALATNPKLLLLDEPAAGMNPKETEELCELILKMKKDFNLSVLLIEHDMPFVNRLCSEVLVLDYGKKLFNGTPQDAINNKEVIAAYLGDYYATN
ncbi:high-affinity branched-chain amino acid ABC transporter ATP-binding protein LivG [Helicobacter pullorum]|uniref:ABC transporter ATP-binding protein n=1 Tax=Helicobacter pullorum TaxID=35818 RepID=UPI0008169ECE|nr:ABC transporter ATP-binding protein [Helicobacter pullorum]OCR04285.1 high-affinity branched-chain amino acid ABC transporter ATP-binding protein LivG [Helicobacter pullorum]OCR08214.1 high-affinity branched-chain amino acid ABC transporter ATP-binding protein LivG [Helicobacter pullorum]OCR11414.1 high-affinity branched-chain amino acid ABC transporter ATP-binding protein LivG [Helicobacter pullorum]OCR12469.1 high-affinity branched-chain amino acid ABC transporter ATP-binding protein LivG 